MALILFCVALYIGASYFLLNPPERDANMNAHMHADIWLRASSEQACSPDGPGGYGGPGDPGGYGGYGNPNSSTS